MSLYQTASHSVIRTRNSIFNFGSAVFLCYNLFAEALEVDAGWIRPSSDTRTVPHCGMWFDPTGLRFKGSTLLVDFLITNSSRHCEESRQPAGWRDDEAILHYMLSSLNRFFVGVWRRLFNFFYRGCWLLFLLDMLYFLCIFIHVFNCHFFNLGYRRRFFWFRFFGHILMFS